MSYRIPLVIDSWSEAERVAARVVVDSDRHTMGGYVAEFERRFAAFVNARHAVMVTSGSMALLLAAFWYAEHIGRYKVVIPAVTWPTTAWSFICAGCKVRFVDVDPETLTMRYDSGGEGTNGFCHVPVHLMGNRCAYPTQGRIIEDGCEALLPMHPKAIACYSMYFSHHLNTVEGGVVCTNDQDVADWLRSARAHGWIRGRSDAGACAERHPDMDSRFLFVTMGFNMKPTELQAAVGLVQLAKARENMEARHHAYLRIAEGIAPLAERIVPMRLVGNPAPFAFPIIAATPEIKAKLVLGLEDGASVETRPIAGGNLTRQPAFRKYADKWTAHGALDGADKIHDCGFFIGLYPGMDTDYVVESIKQAMA